MLARLKKMILDLLRSKNDSVESSGGIEPPPLAVPTVPPPPPEQMHVVYTQSRQPEKPDAAKNVQYHDDDLAADVERYRQGRINEGREPRKRDDATWVDPTHPDAG